MTPVVLVHKLVWFWTDKLKERFILSSKECFIGNGRLCMFYIDQANQVEGTKPGARNHWTHNSSHRNSTGNSRMTRRVGFAWNKDELYGKYSYYMPCYSAINDQSLLYLAPCRWLSAIVFIARAATRRLESRQIIKRGLVRLSTFLLQSFGIDYIKLKWKLPPV